MKFTQPIRGRTNDIENTYFYLRGGMAVLAFTFPFIFLASSFICGRTEFQTSMSAYYWTLDVEQHLFVAVLFAVGMMLILYEGRTIAEDIALFLAGVCAILVAFFPMDMSGNDCGDSSGVSVHGIAGFAFFGCISYVCIFMSKKSLAETDKTEATKKRYRLAYNICATIMSVTVIYGLLTRWLPGDISRWLCENRSIFWTEAVGVWTFSTFWYLKTRELDKSRSWIPFIDLPKGWSR